jgi:two-component system chemotaxis response regulator CheB
MARILLVDDSQVVRNIVRAYLVGLGLEFEFAAEGEEALRLYQAQGADLVVTDFLMPGMDGLELSRRIRALPPRQLASGEVAHPKVVLISSDKKITEQVVVDGLVDAYLPKPLDRELLCAVIAKLLPSEAAASAGPASLVRGSKAVRVVIADDTEVGRTILARIVRADPDFEVVGVAADGPEAVELVVKERPQLVLLDALMPGLDGVAATRQIMTRSPTRVVIVADPHDAATGGQVFTATEAGALEVIMRPTWGDPMGADAVTLRETLKMLAEIPVIRQRPRTLTRPPPSRRPASSRAPKVIGICGSTGGPPALSLLLAELGPALDHAAVLIVQHVLEGFDQPLCDWLRDSSSLPVRLAKPGDMLRAGTVLVAPAGLHLVMSSVSTVTLDDGPPIDGHRPSGTPLFESMARHLGGAALAIILTGMGDDGVSGLAAIKAAGGIVVAQSPDSCVVPGMPSAAVARRVVDVVLPLEHIASEVIGMTRQPTR